MRAFVPWLTRFLLELERLVPPKEGHHSFTLDGQDLICTLRDPRGGVLSSAIVYELGGNPEAAAAKIASETRLWMETETP